MLGDVMSLFRRVGSCALAALLASNKPAHSQHEILPWPRYSHSVDASVARLSIIEEPEATATRRLPPTHSRRDGQALREDLPIPGETVDVFDPHAGMNELSLSQLVDEVLRRNPSLAAAAAAWRAAAQRYPQVVSLDDPMFDWMMAPASLGSNDVDFAYVVQGRQRIPWSGKRPLRGQVAARQSRAASLDVADAELRLTEAAKQAFYEYFLVFRQVELNDANRQALQEFRRNALQRYESSLVSQQDVLLADVELADLERRQIELHRANRVAVARINTLLLRVPDAPLPLPPSTVKDVAAVPSVDVLRDIALRQRPDLGASMSRLRAEQASVALACREFGPDLEFVGRYDTFWQSPQQQLQGQIGVTLNVPLRARSAGRQYARPVLASANNARKLTAWRLRFSSKCKKPMSG